MPKIEMGKKYRTRDGRDARVLYVDGPDKDYPVGAVVSDAIETYSADGKFNTSRNCGYDLIEIPEEVTGWLNINGPNKFSMRGCIHLHKTREAADMEACSERLACIPITYHKGQGLEDNEK